MKKIKIGDLEKIREKVKKTTNLRKDDARVKVTVHMGTCGIASGSRDILTGFMEDIARKKLDDIIVTTSGCAGLCSREPMATVEVIDHPPVKYVDLTREKMQKILEEHIIKGNIVEEFALAIGSERTH